MLCSILALAINPHLIRSTIVDLPGPIFGIYRPHEGRDQYLVHARKGQSDQYFQVDVSNGKSKLLYTFDASLPPPNDGPKRVWKFSGIDRSGYVRESKTYGSGEHDIQYVDAAANQVYAPRRVPVRGPAIPPPFRHDDFPSGSPIPSGDYILADGRQIRIDWDSLEGRYGYEYKHPIAFGPDYDKNLEFEPGTWKAIAPRTDGEARYGAKGGLSGNPQAMPNATVIINEGMSRDTTVTWIWHDSRGRSLPYSGDGLDRRNGFWYAGGMPLRKLADLNGKPIWSRKGLMLGTKMVSANPIKPYRNGSWMGDWLVAATPYDAKGVWCLALLDPDTGKTLFKKYLRKSDRLLAICDSYLLIGRDSRLERWDLKNSASE
jgi:hypothetical protein